MSASIYNPDDLKKEARRITKGLGRFDGWDLEVSNDGARVRGYFIRHYNPHRPKAQQAREFVSTVL